MRQHKKFSRILSMLLVVATLFSLLAVPANAASLKDSGSVTLQHLGRDEFLSKYWYSVSVRPAMPRTSPV